MLARQPAPHLLYVAWGFPPSRGGGVYRALATAKFFARAGWRVTVLTAEREAFARYTGTDTSLEQHIDPRIHIERLPFTWPATRHRHPHLLLASCRTPRSAGAGGSCAARRRASPSGLRAVAADPGERRAAVHAPRPGGPRRGHRQPQRRLHRRLGPAPAPSGAVRHGLPRRLAARRLRRAGCSTPNAARRLAGSGAWSAHAREIWFVNEPIRAWHQRRYPQVADRMNVVANGFDPELAPPPRGHAPDAAGGLTFGYLGTISPKVPLEPR